VDVILPIRTVSSCHLGALSLILNFPSERAEIKGVTMEGVNDPVDWSVKGNELRIGWNSRNPLTLAERDVLVTLQVITTDAFTQGKVIRFTLVNDPLNELAENYYNAIPDAVLSMDLLESSAVGIDEQQAGNGLTLSTYPNPFREQTTIRYTLPFDGMVNLEIFNVLGMKVMSLVNEPQAKGTYSLLPDAYSLMPGVYTITLKLKGSGDEVIKTIKVVKAK
jgi:hypothetical protein